MRRPVNSGPVHQIDLLGAGEIILSADGIVAVSVEIEAFRLPDRITLRDSSSVCPGASDRCPELPYLLSVAAMSRGRPGQAASCWLVAWPGGALLARGPQDEALVPSCWSAKCG